jgi:hypothetical protein
MTDNTSSTNSKIIRVSKFKPAEDNYVTFSSLKTKGKKKYVYCYINKIKKALIQFPEMVMPFPVNINEYSKDPERYSMKKYDLSLSFFSEYHQLKETKQFIEALLLKMEDFDTIVKMKAVEYSKEWFDGREYTLDQIEKIYLPSLRRPNKKYLPTINLKIINSVESDSDSELFPKCRFFDVNENPIEIESDSELKDLLVSKSIVKCIAKCAGIWIREKNYKENSDLETQKLEHQFGVSWELHQLQLLGQIEPKKPTEYAFNSDSDSDSSKSSTPESD